MPFDSLMTALSKLLFLSDLPLLWLIANRLLLFARPFAIAICQLLISKI
jgi:hypothetical protein